MDSLFRAIVGMLRSLLCFIYCLYFLIVIYVCSFTLLIVLPGDVSCAWPVPDFLSFSPTGFCGRFFSGHPGSLTRFHRFFLQFK